MKAKKTKNKNGEEKQLKSGRFSITILIIATAKDMPLIGSIVVLAYPASFECNVVMIDLMIDL